MPGVYVFPLHILDLRDLGVGDVCGVCVSLAGYLLKLYIFTDITCYYLAAPAASRAISLARRALLCAKQVAELLSGPAQAKIHLEQREAEEQK